MALSECNISCSYTDAFTVKQNNKSSSTANQVRNEADAHSQTAQNMLCLAIQNLG